MQGTLAGSGDIAIAKLSPSGALLASTYVGGGDVESADSIHADAAGQVVFAGQTKSPTSR